MQGYAVESEEVRRPGCHLWTLRKEHAGYAQQAYECTDEEGAKGRS